MPYVLEERGGSGGNKVIYRRTTIRLEGYFSLAMEDIEDNGILFSHKKEGNHAIYDNMNEPVGHYASWNKPDIERQIINIVLCHLYVDSKKSWTLRNRV